MEAFVTGIVDNWPNQLRKHRRLFVICTIVVIFLLALPMITEVSYFVNPACSVPQLHIAKHRLL